MSKLTILVCVVVAILTVAMVTRAEHPDILAELPNQPMVFNSPEELRTYLQELDKYFAIAGRPRFGRNVGGGYMRNIFPYYRTNGMSSAF